MKKTQVYLILFHFEKGEIMKDFLLKLGLLEFFLYIRVVVGGQFLVAMGRNCEKGGGVVFGEIKY